MRFFMAGPVTDALQRREGHHAAVALVLGAVRPGHLCDDHPTSFRLDISEIPKVLNSPEDAHVSNVGASRA